MINHRFVKYVGLFSAFAFAAFLLSTPATASADTELVAPAYPADLRDKPFEINVVACGAVDGGKATACRIIFTDGPPPFATAATSAFEKSDFDAGLERATVWYVFRLMRDTEVFDISRGRHRDFDAAPELIEYVAPTFPPGAPSLRTEVSLDILIAPDGSVWYAEQAGDGADPLYVERALAAAREFEFKPASFDGEPTATWYQFVIEFK
jgi:hypothetical protein